MIRFLLLASMLLLGACTSRLEVPPEIMASEKFSAVTENDRPPDYKIGPLDELTITVFQEPDLSIKDAPVDASGNLFMPLIGTVHAAGKSSSDLSQEIAAAYGARYLVNPQVSVLVSRAVALNVTVDGQVKKPGVYALDGGRTSLIQAIARAEGPTETAAIEEVLVLRREDGKRYAAKFDLAAIRSGQMADPEIVGGDVVIVDSSAARGVYQDILRSAPLLGPLFILLAQ